MKNIDEIARECARQIRGCATDEQYAAVVDQIESALASERAKAIEKAAKVADAASVEMRVEADTATVNGDARNRMYRKAAMVADSIADLIRSLPAPAQPREAEWIGKVREKLDRAVECASNEFFQSMLRCVEEAAALIPAPPGASEAGETGGA